MGITVALLLAVAIAFGFVSFVAFTIFLTNCWYGCDLLSEIFTATTDD